MQLDEVMQPDTALLESYEKEGYLLIEGLSQPGWNA